MARDVMIAANRVRGFWRTGLGQRVEEWVRPGVYDVGPEETVDGVAVVVLTGDNGWSWYVPLAVVAQLPGRAVV